ncbi:putative cytokinetic ring protein SteA [Aeromicrobium sp.]|uniref:putative cytokinetic ring protein SteA n=1 Tax=Aeromicrobium sp. TaxID=1871063 RepID=UPI003C6FFD6D
MSQDASGVVGTVRLARSRRLIAALRAGDVAVVDLPELDAREAQQLIDQRVRAVLNASRSSSGRVPNVGPQMLSRAGILLVDVPSDEIWSKLKNGERVRIEDGRILRQEIVVLTGVELDEARATSDLAQAESSLATKLDSLSANASDHIQREQSMLLAGANVPRLRTKLRGRAVVVVSRAYDDAADLRGLRRYINDSDPILIGAGPGADVLLKAGYEPAIVVGHLDHLSDAAIRAAGEVVVSTASGTVDRPERLERHGKEIVTFVSSGSDDDLAILLADTNEAAVIVHVGAPPTLSTFLERPPADVARMFVARLRAGAKIVDAKAVIHFTSKRHALWPALLLLVAGVVSVAVAIAVTPVGQDWYHSLGGQLADLGTWIKGLFS